MMITARVITANLLAANTAVIFVAIRVTAAPTGTMKIWNANRMVVVRMEVLIMADLIEMERALKVMEICGYKNAAQLISHMPAASPWIPCSERMPDENSGIYPCVFIVWNDLRPQEGIYSGYPHIGFYNRNFKGWQDDSGNIYFDSDGYVTHWFPMPDIPKFPKLKEGAEQ